MKDEVFISYSRKDTAIADQICEAFDKAGISYFIDRQGIGGGMEFPKVLANNILDSQIFLFIASKNSYESLFTDREITFAFNKIRGEKMLPYIIDNAPFPKHLELIFASNNWRRLAEHPIEPVLIDDVFRLLGKERQNIGIGSSPLNPKNIIDDFPEYGFQPTSLMPTQTKNPTSAYYTRLGWCFFILSLFCVFALSKEADSTKSAILASVGVELVPTILIIVGYSMKNKPFLNIKTEADYIASKFTVKKPLRGYKQFFVKDRKFGVLSISGRFKDILQYKILIPAKYDKLSWKSKGKILVAEQDGKSFLIDIYGNILN